MYRLKIISPGNGIAADKLLNSLVKFVNLCARGSIPLVFRPYFFSANLTALGKKDGGIRSIAVGNTLRRIVSKCAGAAVKDDRKSAYGTLQLGYGLSGGAEAAAHSARLLVESDVPDDFVLVKVDFKNAFNSLSREVLLKTTHSDNPSVYNYTFSAYSQRSYLFYGNTILWSEEGVQQGDPEGL